jgi:DNA-binding transcriptional LysR family regulator
MALERVLGVRLLHRTSRTITPTTVGVHALAQARQVLAAADNLVAEATTGHTRPAGLPADCRRGQKDRIRHRQDATDLRF